jgi:CDP-glycerol glycerophosphotransferase (TagB/SpsB family)/glycosyltransferase involved in cell wall biosynthesis
MAPHPVTRLRRFAGKVRLAIRYEIYAYWRSKPVRSHAVMYESFAGNGMLCNPEAIFRSLLTAPEFSDLTHVWVLNSRRENRETVAEFRHDKRVRFVRPRSVGYYRALATSGYLINNATFPPEFGKRAGQLYLNTWHGTPLKKMGFDIGDPASRVGNVIRNFLNADYLLAANRFMTEQMYERAHLLRDIYRGRIIETGYPRIDRQLMSPEHHLEARERLHRAGLTLGARQIILYAPTWKGTNFNRPEDDARELIERVQQLQSLVDSDRYVVLLKTHQIVHKFASRRKEFAGILVPNEIPTNVVLGVTDVLVTDYSSIFFDFLATGRPIAFLTPDIDDYAGYRGLYMEPETWPGPITRTVEELADALIAIAQHGRSAAVLENYRAMRERFTNLEDGGATKRVIDIVFRGTDGGASVRSVQNDGKQSILFNAGSMRPNGITSSLLNLLDSIDYSRFDVSVVFPTSYRRVVIGKQSEINANVRQFSRTGGMNGSKLLHLGRRRAWATGDLSTHASDPAQRRFWDDEWRRCFGESSFDYMVDFSGYGLFWATLSLHAPRAICSIWLHNDLAADAHRVVRGKRRQLQDLTGVFSLYREYDHLVSVSSALSAINASALGEHADAAKFKAAPNLVNATRVRRNATADLAQLVTDYETGELPPWADALLTARGVTTFVTTGRLSPEKNHARLIRAFERVHSAQPNSRLLIIGSGPLRDALEKQIAELGLAGAVWLTGHQANPHAIMALADCFVLSSDYEGQPMVLLEALVLDLPVVTVAFGSAADALPPGIGLVVPATDAALADGMVDYLDGRVPRGHFDVEAYNAAAISQFYSAIGTNPDPHQKDENPKDGVARGASQQGTRDRHPVLGGQGSDHRDGGDHL